MKYSESYIYVIKGYAGQSYDIYCDGYEWIVASYLDEKEAEEHCEWARIRHEEIISELKGKGHAWNKIGTSPELTNRFDPDMAHHKYVHYDVDEIPIFNNLEEYLK